MRVRTASPVAGRCDWDGDIEGVDEGRVSLKISEGQIVQVPLSEMVRAKLLIGA